jgi:hypothetical protein
MNKLKQSEVVKLITVTLTQILQEIELLDFQLAGVELLGDTRVVAKIKINNTCLPSATENTFIVKLKLTTLEGAIGVSANMFLKVLQKAVGMALQMKRNRK